YVDYSSTVTITNCYNTGNVSARASWGVATSALVISSSAGGLVGIAQANSLTISSSYNTGSVFASANSRPNFSGSSSTATAGGIIGEMYTGSVIHDCYNRGDITANIIAGSAGSGDNTRAGGIVGFIASDSISNTYNTGNIQSTNPQTANRHIGSIFGLSTVAINMFNNYESANIGNIFNFIGFDFQNVWRRISGVNDNLPVLRAFYNFCAVCDRDPCVCVVAPDLCIECKKEICVCCPDCDTYPCECIDAPDLCIECKKEICECKPEPKVCSLCNETPCVCGIVAIAPGSSPVVSVIIAPKTKISINGGEPFEADADKLTLKVVKNTPTSGEAKKFFAALKDYLSS
ncbi:MAG: hypothetical protein FWE60_03195, partial [Oscillospiraceae bacterium]|nr:hypothetical protein [Oscillospiraceae bacterium]